MALAPQAAAAPADDQAGAMPADMGAPDADADQDTEDTVLVTICKSADGTYTVYKGDEPDEAGEGTPGEEGAEAQEPAEPQGQPADSIGKALKIALDILQGDESESGGGGQAAFDAGFGGDEGGAAAPAGQAQS